MKQTATDREEVQRILTDPRTPGNERDDPDTPLNEIDVYIEPDRITFIPIRLHGVNVNERDGIDSSVGGAREGRATLQKHAPTLLAHATLSVSLLLVLSIIVLQLSFLLNPPTATVTFVVKSQQRTLHGTLGLGRVLHPITLSQSQTAPTTGHGHQDARAATGELTFYNGQFQSVFVPAGPIFTGTDEVQVITDADATIPAGNPPAYGQVTVSAHASNAGASGNIAAYDMNQTCCAASVLVKNTAPFQGGQDERNFQTLAQSDIDNTASPLKAALAQSVQGALQGQLKRGEQLQTLPCSQSLTSNHQPGQEATAVTVTASETCSGIAYNRQELTDKVTQLLTSQAATKLGAGYSLLERPHIAVTGATTAKRVMVAFTAVSTWVYALTTQEQQHIKNSIAGKNTQEALQIVRSLPGIESASIQWGDMQLPKDIRHIHIAVIV